MLILQKYRYCQNISAITYCNYFKKCLKLFKHDLTYEAAATAPFTRWLPPAPTMWHTFIKGIHSKEESCTADSKSLYSVRNKCHGTNSWAALEHGALSPHWESEDSQQPVFKGPAIVQTEEPILKLVGQERKEVGNLDPLPHGVTRQCQICFQGLGRLQTARTSSPLAALGQPWRHKHA